jgi:carbon monoxide dehydrogenase subunit G
MAMKFQGTVNIDAPRERVFEFLTDPHQITQCAPDVKSLDVIDPDHFKVVVRAGVGFVKATFAMDVNWLERNSPESAVAKARGNAPGSAVDMTASMQLVEDGKGTRLDWQADVTVAGTIASVGARLMQGAANSITGQVFACVKKKLEAGGEGGAC